MLLGKCDKCGKVDEKGIKVNYDVPEGWEKITFSIRYQKNKNYILCPECVEKLGIPKTTDEKRQHIGDNLLEIIEEIAREAAQDVMTGN